MYIITQRDYSIYLRLEDKKRKIYWDLMNYSPHYKEFDCYISEPVLDKLNREDIKEIKKFIEKYLNININFSKRELIKMSNSVVGYRLKDFRIRNK